MIPSIMFPKGVPYELPTMPFFKKPSENNSNQTEFISESKKLYFQSFSLKKSEISPNRKQLLVYHNPKTHKIKFATPNFQNMTQTLKKSNFPKSTLKSANSYKKIVEMFGSRQAKNVNLRLKRQKNLIGLGSGKNIVKEVSESIKKTKKKRLSSKENDSDNFQYVPNYDVKKKKAEDVFDIKNCLPDQYCDSEEVLHLCKVFKNPKKIDKFLDGDYGKTFSKTLSQIIKNIASKNDAAGKNTAAALIIYCHYLFHLYKNFKNKKALDEICCPKMAQNWILVNFSQQNSDRNLKSKIRKKLLCHILIFVFSLFDFKVNQFDFIQLMNDIGEKNFNKMAKLIKKLGFKYSFRNKNDDQKNKETICIQFLPPFFVLINKKNRKKKTRKK